MNNNQNILDTMDGQMVAGLLLVPDLDALQAIYVSNSIADKSPRLQRAMLAMFQTERDRRERDEDSQPEGIEIPDFDTWPTGEMLVAGMVIIAGAESCAMTGHPAMVNFGFRLLQKWFVSEGKRFEVTHA